MKIKQIACLILILLSSITCPSTLVLYQLPKSIDGIISKMQERTASLVSQLNKDSKIFLFKKNKQMPHITLSYITKEKIELKELIDQAPVFLNSLFYLTNDKKSMDITQNFKDSKVDFFTAKPKSKKTKRAFKYLVLRLSLNNELHDLANKLNENMSQFAFYQKKNNKFIAHVTLGGLYHTSEPNIADSLHYLQENLESYFASISPEFKELIIVDSIKLIGNNFKTVTFSLNGC